MQIGRIFERYCVSVVKLYLWSGCQHRQTRVVKIGASSVVGGSHVKKRNFS
nr:MAG TPA: hypothetical protein [Caudoviricetes sp.]